MKVIESKKGVYRLSNGLEFQTLSEVKAFLQGLQFAQSNINQMIDMVIINAAKELK